jgi:hypothetical protein
MSKLLHAPRLAASTATASTRASRDQDFGGMVSARCNTASLAAKVSTTDPLRERVASPASPAFPTAVIGAAGLYENAGSRHATKPTFGPD